MKLNIQFKGLDQVIANLNKKINEIEDYTTQGVVAAALLVKGEAMRKTPVDLSNLVNSAYVVWNRGQGSDGSESPSFKGDKAAEMGSQHGIVRAAAQTSLKPEKGPTAIIGFTAAYAVYVHEIDKNYRKPGSSWKFLELALMENEQKILDLIKQSVKKGAQK